MTIGTGTGNTISFSTIRDFYGDTNPVAISDFNRNTSNNTLVDATFVGASTVTTNNVSATKNDFGITVANDSTSSTITGSSNPMSFTIDTGSGGGSTVTISLTNNNTDEGSATLTRGGSQILTTTGSTVTGTVNDGDFLTMSGSGNANPVFSYPRLTRVYDVTFANNNSTGDTYTLASSSTGHSTKSVYAAGESQQVKNNSASNQWTIAYDNVTGAGPGTAGDINVTETSAFTGSLGSIISRVNTSVSNNSGGSTISDTYTVLASDSVLILGGGGQNHQSGADGDGFDPVGSWSTSGIINISPVASGQGKFYTGPAYQSGDSSDLTFSGSISAGTFTITGSVGTAGGGVSVSTRRRAEQFTTVFTNSNGSTSYTLGSSSTGGAATLAASATRNAQTTGSSGSSWAVHFDTSSGDCNVGIPTTIGAGNPVNLNLFNTVTTPVG